MIIDNKSPLAPYTHIIDDYGHRRAFQWIDPVKKIGIELILTDICDHEKNVHKLEWQEGESFPYNVMIRDPVTNEEHINPCIHDIANLLNKAKLLQKERLNLMNKLYI